MTKKKSSKRVIRRSTRAQASAEQAADPTRFVSRSNFAALAGVSCATITIACTRGTMPSTPGGSIDLEHKRIKVYLELQLEKKIRKQIRAQMTQTTLAPEPVKNIAPPVDTPAPELMEPPAMQQIETTDLDGQWAEFVNPVNELDVDGFVNSLQLPPGDLGSLSKLASIRKQEADRRLKMQKLQIARGELVEKKQVVGASFAYLDVLDRRLLDIGGTIVDQIIALTKSAGPGARAKILELFADTMKGAIQNSKTEVTTQMKKFDSGLDEGVGNDEM